MESQPSAPRSGEPPLRSGSQRSRAGTLPRSNLLFRGVSALAFRTSGSSLGRSTGSDWPHETIGGASAVGSKA
jgi:hypothetical protein